MLLCQGALVAGAVGIAPGYMKKEGYMTHYERLTPPKQELFYTAAPGQPDFEIAFSNLDLLKWKAATIGVNELRDRLSEMGYADTEVTPTYALVRDIGRLAARQAFHNEQGGQRLVGSVHQSFAPALGKVARQAFSRPPQQTARDFILSRAMPETHASLQDMQRMQAWAGYRLPAIVYPNYQHNGEAIYYDQQNAPFAERLTQLYPALYQAYGITNSSLNSHRLKEQLAVHEVNGVCISPFHMRRTSPVSNNIAWSALLDEIERDDIPLQEIHIEAGRDDMAPGNDAIGRATAQEKDALLHDADAIAKTELGDIVQRSVDIWKRQQGTAPHKPLRQVVEVTANSLNAPDEPSFIAMHQAIRHNLGAFTTRLLAA